MTTLVGGVGQLYQGDLDLGRLLVEKLAGELLGPEVVVEELHYGAVAVAQRLEELRPGALVLAGAAPRGRTPGTVVRRRVTTDRPATAEAVGRAVAEAATGYVDLDLVIEVGLGLAALPARTVVIEVEPASTGPGEGLSPAAASALAMAAELVRAEVRRVPLQELGDRLAPLVSGDRLGPGPGLAALRDLLGALSELDVTGQWGPAFRHRDRLRSALAGGGESEGMDGLDWALWWALVEEMDRLESREGACP